MFLSSSIPGIQLNARFVLRQHWWHSVAYTFLPVIFFLFFPLRYSKLQRKSMLNVVNGINEKATIHQIWANESSCYYHHSDSFFFGGEMVFFHPLLLNWRCVDHTIYGGIVTNLIIILYLRALGRYTSWSHLFLIHFLDCISYYLWNCRHWTTFRRSCAMWNAKTWKHWCYFVRGGSGLGQNVVCLLILCDEIINWIKSLEWLKSRDKWTIYISANPIFTATFWWPYWLIRC